jgi:hypothetical protein
MDVKCLHSPNNELFPANISINESNCSQSSGEVQLCLKTSKDGSTETETHGDTPYYAEEAYIMEENPLRYVLNAGKEIYRLCLCTLR